MNNLFKTYYTSIILQSEEDIKKAKEIFQKCTKGNDKALIKWQKNLTNNKVSIYNKEKKKILTININKFNKNPQKYIKYAEKHLPSSNQNDQKETTKKSTQNDSKGPFKLIINGENVDDKKRKKILYNIKKALISKKIINKNKTSNTTLVAMIDKSNNSSLDDLYTKNITPIIKQLGIQLDDKKYNIDKNTLTIKL